ncbi:CWC16 protein [Nemania abortiva]|nr:CWC16 protein [Nemania abortiva]
MQGFNMGRYVPPDVEGTVSGNALNRKHALGARASKLRTEGILTVRFEMPFGVWCGTCARPTVIGQGVRFNAEKKRVGAYHSTPIWSFRMRHADCGGAIEIRTDPANAEYVVVEGGTRRDTGAGKDDDDSLVSSRALLAAGGEILTEQERDARRNDAFARLEKTIEDRGVLVERSHRIAELEDASHRAWEDPYAQNRRLRDTFRAGRKAREKAATSTDELRERMSLGIDLLPATEEDARRAALVDFGVAPALDSSPETNGSGNDRISRIKDTALMKPLFSTRTTSGARNAAPKIDGAATKSNKPGEQKGKNRLRSEIKASQTRESLASTVTRNTRALQDPFLIPSTPESRSRGGGEGTASRAPSKTQGIKRKRPDASVVPSQPPSTPKTSTSTAKKHRNTGVKLVEEEEEGEEEEGKERQGDRLENGDPASTEAEDAPPAASDSRARLKTALVEYDSD